MVVETLMTVNVRPTLLPMVSNITGEKEHIGWYLQQAVGCIHIKSNLLYKNHNSLDQVNSACHECLLGVGRLVKATGMVCRAAYLLHWRDTPLTTQRTP